MYGQGEEGHAGLGQSPPPGDVRRHITYYDIAYYDIL